MRRAIWLLALIGVTFSAGALSADAFGPMSVRAAAHPFRLGALKLTALHDSQIVLPNDGKIFGVDASAGEVSEVLRAAGAPTDRITLSINALLVRTGGHLVLIDAGFGP